MAKDVDDRDRSEAACPAIGHEPCRMELACPELVDEVEAACPELVQVEAGHPAIMGGNP